MVEGHAQIKKVSKFQLTNLSVDEADFTIFKNRDLLDLTPTKHGICNSGIFSVLLIVVKNHIPNKKTDNPSKVMIAGFV